MFCGNAYRDFSILFAGVVRVGKGQRSRTIKFTASSSRSVCATSAIGEEQNLPLALKVCQFPVMQSTLPKISLSLAVTGSGRGGFVRDSMFAFR